jgi:DNA-binding MarR family transcriptional regulator
VGLSGDLSAVGDALVSDLGLSRARWQVLAAVHDCPATVAAVARQLGLTRQSVQRSASRLVADGLAELAPNPHHRRADLLAATAKGAEALASARRRHEAWAQKIADALADHDLAAACRVLHRLQQLLGDSG